MAMEHEIDGALEVVSHRASQAIGKRAQSVRLDANHILTSILHEEEMLAEAGFR